MAFVATMPTVQLYDIIPNMIEVDHTVYCEYGILQNSVNESNELVQVRVDGISTDVTVVEDLIRILEKEDVSASTLHDIVEDYINGIYSVK